MQNRISASGANVCRFFEGFWFSLVVLKSCVTEVKPSLMVAGREHVPPQLSILKKHDENAAAKESQVFGFRL